MAEIRGFYPPRPAIWNNRTGFGIKKSRTPGLMLGTRVQYCWEPRDPTRLALLKVPLFGQPLGMQWFVSSEMRVGFGYVVWLPGNHFERRNAREFWNDASGGRKRGRCGGSVKSWKPGGHVQWEFVFPLLARE